MSSTKLLKFLVSDLLDFSQLRAGKFRKDCGNFDIKESIEEIIMIQEYKADQNGVQILFELENFPEYDDTTQIIRKSNNLMKNYSICSD